MTTPLADLDQLAERFQAIAQRTPAKYRQEIQTIADLIGAAADFAHSHLAQRILGRDYADLGVIVPDADVAPAPPAPPVIVVDNDLRRHGVIPTSRLLDYIRDNPGVTIYAVAAELGMSYAVAHSRLTKLQRRGILAARGLPSRIGKPRLCFWLADTPAPTMEQLAGRNGYSYIPPEPLPDLPSNNSEKTTDDDVLWVLRKTPGADADEITLRIGGGKSGVHKRLMRMAREGKITRTEGTRPVRYYVAEAVQS